ncbi:hypothetical protein ACVQ8M_17265 (plasmid) [Edwardsiella tarda]|uniref:hypothetical protein n=2 Tax=Hafniaceae TaxID=1903412 RepID=UPI001F16F204|nr:hypothetical protein [Edwardsiella piscicida]UJT80761.1 hypothetical protein L1P06_17820 [Edwardsiella piscicida]
MTTPLIVPIVNYLPQLLTGLLSAGAALGGVLLTQHRIDKRERAAAAKKADEERLFISTELVFVLERFVEDCVKIVIDDGEENADGDSYPTTDTPVELYLNAISGNWRALPGWLMYRIRELPALIRDAERRIVYKTEISTPPQHTEFFKERQYQYARLGIQALILSIRLRRLVGLPPTRQNATKWSAQTVFWTAWRNERKRRAKDARLYRELDQD